MIDVTNIFEETISQMMTSEDSRHPEVITQASLIAKSNKDVFKRRLREKERVDTSLLCSIGAVQNTEDNRKVCLSGAQYVES